MKKFLMVTIAIMIAGVFVSCESKSGKMVKEREMQEQITKDSLENLPLTKETIETYTPDTTWEVSQVQMKSIKDSTYIVSFRGVKNSLLCKLSGQKSYYNQILTGLFYEGFLRGYFKFSKKDNNLGEIWFGPFDGPPSQGISGKVRIVKVIKANS